MSIEQNNNEINFSDVNWNSLSKEEFRQLEVRAQKQVKDAKAKTPSVAKVIKKVLVVIGDEQYLVSAYHAELLNGSTDLKKSNIVKEIKRVYFPIEEI